MGLSLRGIVLSEGRLCFFLEVSRVLTLARFFLPLTEPGKGLEDGFFLCARVGTSEFGLEIKGRPSLLLVSWAVGACVGVYALKSNLLACYK